MPGCIRYASALRGRSAISRVCPEAKVELNVANRSRDEHSLNLKGILMSTASENGDIFCFRTHPLRHHVMWTKTTSLLSTLPQIRPAQIAVEVVDGNLDANFELSDVNGASRARHVLPRWFVQSIEWAHEARQESVSGLQVVVKPPQEALALDFQDLRTVFVLSYGIDFMDRGNSGSSRRDGPPAHAYTSFAEGVESWFYTLDPASPQILQHWSIPRYVWTVREEMQRLLASSETWRVDVKFMAAIAKNRRRKWQSSLLKALTVNGERTMFLSHLD